MSKTEMKIMSAVCCYVVFLHGSVGIVVPTTVQRLADGNTFICDAGGPINQYRSKVLEVDERGSMEWAHIFGGLRWVHSAQKLDNGNILMSNTTRNEVIEVDRYGTIVWQYNTGLNYPNDADRLSNGNTLITDRDNNRVIEVTPSSTIAWSYNLLNGPHNADRLTNGNTIVCNSNLNRVVEINPAGQIVWFYDTGLNWPRDADRLANGNTLITDTHNHRIIEVTSNKVIVWNCPVSGTAYDADRLANGNTLITNDQYGVADSAVIEVNPSKTVVWQYPKTIETAVDTVWIYNPASGCTLYAHIHYPVDASSTNRFPAVIMIPEGNETGTTYDTSERADQIADDGFILCHFDPDARGQSTNHGTIIAENYCGYSQQDGLWQILKYIHDRPYVDTARIGVYAEDYGITMASGTLSRHMNDPYVLFLLDWEGPADRSQTCEDSGGHVPVPADSESFWIEREAGRFMRSVSVHYLRIQTADDHNPAIADNRHAIALIDSGTACAYGGKGVCLWTRINDSIMNQANTVYTLINHPEWLPESLELFDDTRNLLYLHELASKGGIISVEDNKSGMTSTLYVPSIQRKNTAFLEISTNTSEWISIKTYDVAGRLSENVHQGLLSQGKHHFRLHVSDGIHFVVIQRQTRMLTKKFVVLD